MKKEQIANLHEAAVKAVAVAKGESLRPFCVGKRGEAEGMCVPALVALGRLDRTDFWLYRVVDFRDALEAALKEERSLHTGNARRILDNLLVEIIES